MAKIWNSKFELSLRALMLLYSDNTTPKTLDVIALLDTITIYGGDFGISDENLHGEIDFALDEFDTMREIMKNEIKGLILRGLVIATKGNGGFSYKISPIGDEYCKQLTSDYAVEYMSLAKGVKNLVGSQSEKEIFDMISKEISGS